MKFELKKEEVKLFEQKRFGLFERVVQRSLVTNKQNSQLAYIHLIPYKSELQIGQNRSPKTTNY